MSDAVIEFFDIPDNQSPPSGWSPNTIKTQLVLNFKKIPYKHTFLEYPDIAPTLKSLGTPAPPNIVRPYTCPAIGHPGTLPHPLMDSFPIACHLEKNFPQNSIFPTPGSKALAEAINYIVVNNLFPVAAPIMLPRVLGMLSEKSAKYFRETREQSFGMSVEEFAKNGDVAAFLKVWGGIGQILNLEEGPFFLGTTPSYADFVIVAFIAWFPAQADLFDKVLDAENGAFRKLWEASKQWL